MLRILQDRLVSAPVTVVGAGISGIACARALSAAGVPVRVLDRGRRPGGRMASRTFPDRVVDTGASYLTAAPGSPFAAVVEDWVARGLARPWTDTFAVAGPGGLEDRKSGPVRYAAPAGLRSLVADLAAGLDVRQEHTVQRVGTGPEGAAVDGEQVPAAVLALPGPQARRLVDDDLAGALLDGSEWQPSLAVVLGFDQRGWDADLHGAFVHDEDAVEWIADDGDRRGDAAPVLVAHTPPALAARHLDRPEDAVPAVAAAVTRVLGLAAEPAWTEVHRWTFARPAAPREEPYGLRGLTGACGDGWSAPSRVQSAWASGDALGTALAGLLG